MLLVMVAFNPFAFAQAQFDTAYVGPYEDVAGQFYIRTYIVYCQTDENEWADTLGTAELQRRTARSFELLNSVFNQHDIYFIPGEASPGACHGIFTQINQESPPDFGNGITIHVYSDDNLGAGYATGQTESNTIPALKFLVRGKEGDDPGSNLPVLIHEMGHCFGLAHTFESTNADNTYKDTDWCSMSSCIGNPGNDPDNCCGDFVDDTPKHGITASIEISDDCCCSENPQNVGPDIFKNFMSYSHPTRCRDHFTPEQVLRMRKYLKYAEKLDTVLIIPDTIPAGNPVTWSTVQSKFTNIEVPSGATLIVDGRLSIAPGAFIIVRPGGTLIVNDTITAECNGMWGGVIVEGKATEPQKESNGQYSTAQGRILLNPDGLIEHAMYGIGIHGEDKKDDDFGGGIAEIKGKIRNCTHAVRFGRYRRDNSPNVSYLSGAQITLTDDYRGVTQPKPVLLYMKDINRLSIAGTWFYDLRTEGCEKRASRADGLIADDAGFSINSSLFRNLDNGIIASPTEAGGYGSYTLRNSYFYNCFTEVYSALPDPFTIVNNYFEVGRPPACSIEASDGTIRGVHVSGYPLPQGIVLSDNIFEAGNNTGEETLIGTDCFGTGNMENFISNNDYEALDYGNRAAGGNGGATGLRYECNDNTGNQQADFYVTSSGTVRSIQGNEGANDVTTAAGNKFIDIITYSWLNEGTGDIIYYYDATDPVQNPGGSSDFVGIEKEIADQSNSNCGTDGEGCENPPCETTEVSAWKSNFSQQKSSWLTKIALLPSLSGSAAVSLAKEITAHRSAMDIEGGKVIRNFALDSTGVKADSVLIWTAQLRTYEADVRLARHYFFSRDFSTYYQWLDDIPERNELSTAQADELDELEQMLNAVRPSLQTGIPLHRLSAETLDDLESWASECTEPGFIAKEILRRNGRSIVSECEGSVEERPLSGIYKTQALSGINLYPNPANGLIFIDLPKQVKSATFSLYSLDGRLLLEQNVVSPSPVSVSDIPQGIYICRIEDGKGTRFHSKLILSH